MRRLFSRHRPYWFCRFSILSLPSSAANSAVEECHTRIANTYTTCYFAVPAGRYDSRCSSWRVSVELPPSERRSPFTSDTTASPSLRRSASSLFCLRLAGSVGPNYNSYEIVSRNSSRDRKSRIQRNRVSSSKSNPLNQGSRTPATTIAHPWPSFTSLRFHLGIITSRSFVPFGTHWQLRRDSVVTPGASSSMSSSSSVDFEQVSSASDT